MSRGQFTSSHGFKKGDIINVHMCGTTKAFVVTHTTDTIADLKPYRWYHKLWAKIKGLCHKLWAKIKGLWS